MTKPKINSAGQQELDKVNEQFEEFDSQIKSMTLDRLNKAPVVEVEPQTKLSDAQKSRLNQLYLKPKRTISSRETFNEKFRQDYEFQKEYVNFTAENKEIIGETIELWVKPFPGIPAEEWNIPTNKPVWAPRYVAERIKQCSYHRFVMQQAPVGQDGMGQYYGSMAVDTTIQRLDALPESGRKSIFMGSKSF